MKSEGIIEINGYLQLQEGRSMTQFLHLSSRNGLQPRFRRRFRFPVRSGQRCDLHW